MILTKWHPPADIPRGGSVRGDCPFCGGTNTFIMNNDRGTILWFCFRASCHARGAEKGRRTVTDMKQETQEPPWYEETIKEIYPTYDIPMHFKKPFNHPEAMQWLELNNCLWAFSTDHADIRYDPALDRVVFISYHDGRPTGATGRKLASRKDGPKWYEYTNQKTPFIVGTSGDGVIVEDPASACAVAATKKVTGIALRGTVIPLAYVPILSLYDSLIIALDNDASKNAIELHRSLSHFVGNVRVALLRQDLKYCKPDAILKVLNV